VRRERLSVPREVRLLAPFAALQLDAYIASHDAKYLYWRLRPNMADPTLVPLIPQPNHPAYVSNAAIIASAAAALVGHIFPQEAAQWQYLGEEAGLSRIYGGIHYPSDERAGNQMSVLAIKWASASVRWRSSAISSTGRRAGNCTRHSNCTWCMMTVSTIIRGSATTASHSHQGEAAGAAGGRVGVAWAGY
jgi:hypothetical protein